MPYSGPDAENVLIHPSMYFSKERKRANRF
jgi:hypothetical protein